MDLSLTELEETINRWRVQHPATGEERTLAPEVAVLAEVYALMIYHRMDSVPLALLDERVRRLVAGDRAQRPAP